MTTAAPSTETSSLVPSRTGTTTLPSVRGAALQAIPIELGCSPESVMALCALYTGLLRQTLCGDVIVLSIYEAEQIAAEAGLAPEEFERVKKLVLTYWMRERSKNPLSGMF